MCEYCKQPDQYQVGVARFDRRKVKEVMVFVCLEHVPYAINDVQRVCLGTILWPVVLDLEGKLIYHSYDAEKERMDITAGWHQLNIKA